MKKYMNIRAAAIIIFVLILIAVIAAFSVYNAGNNQIIDPSININNLNNGNNQQTQPPFTHEYSDLIFVHQPNPHDVISSPVRVTGEARGYWFFEATFPIEVTDEQGNTLGEWYAQAIGEWMTESFVPFHADISFHRGQHERGYLVIHRSNPSGLAEHDASFRIPVNFVNSAQNNTATERIKVYFENTQTDPNRQFCHRVYPVYRDIPLQQDDRQKAMAAMSELLRGVLPHEAEMGYVSDINIGVGINSFEIQNRIAQIDFTQAIEFEVRDVCRISTIRSQIIQTLDQFPFIDAVSITIDGRTQHGIQL